MSRAQCPRCLRPQSACICQWITPTPNQAEVLVLQHPLEVHQAKGSARLLHLSLEKSELITGECFDQQALHGWLHAKGRVNVLLYPATPEAEAEAAPQPLTAVPADPAQVRLVVLDGTWRKSLKMLHLNPMLHQLPRLALQTSAPSQYLIRKAHRPDQRSTLEATCLALQQLESAPERYTPLLAAFDTFVASLMRASHAPRQA